MQNQTAQTDREVLSAGDIRGQLGRILAYADLQASDRRKAMLRLIVEETLNGRSTRLKSTTIAVEVFGRSADFDPSTDPVVRLEARKLRRDLDNYYAGAGRDDPIRIEIPKGAYVPVFTATSAPELRAPVATGAPSPPGRVSERTLLRGLVALLTLALVASVAWQAGQDGTQIANEPAAPRMAPLGTATIIVDGFASPEGSPEDAIVAEGLSQEIAARLLQFPDLRVHFSPATSAAERGVVPASIRKAEGSYILFGSIRSQEGQITVRAELTRGADSRVLWSERYSEPLEARSIWEIEADLASRMSAVIGEQYGIVPTDVTARMHQPAADPTMASFLCVSRAQAYRRTHLEEAYADVRACLEEAVQRDPDYPRAWAMLSYLRFDAARFGYADTPDRGVGLQNAADAASRALALDPDNIEALKALSLIEQYRGNFDRSIDYARQAVAVNPNDPGALANLGNRLGMRGQFSDAVPLLERAIDLSVAPVPFYWQMIAFDHMMNGRWEEMRRAAEAASADNSSIGYALLAIAYGRLGDTEAARRNLRLMEGRWSMLATEPRRALEGHELDPAIIDETISGLVRAGLEPSTK